jgi:hypothetical protein
MSTVAEFPAPTRAPQRPQPAAGARRNAIDWFEIPVVDLDRAQFFYEFLLCVPMRRESIDGSQLALFQYDGAGGGAGGCLYAGPDARRPGESGTLIYLNAGPSLDEVLSRVNAAGGRIVTTKVQLPGDMGVYAHIVDSEGNRIGLHAPR